MTVPAWDVQKVRPKSEIIRQAKKDGKNSSLEELDGPLEIQGASCAPTSKDEEGYRDFFHRAQFCHVGN